MSVWVGTPLGYILARFRFPALDYRHAGRHPDRSASAGAGNQFADSVSYQDWRLDAGEVARGPIVSGHVSLAGRGLGSIYGGMCICGPHDAGDV